MYCCQSLALYASLGASSSLSVVAVAVLSLLGCGVPMKNRELANDAYAGRARPLSATFTSNWMSAIRASAR